MTYSTMLAQPHDALGQWLVVGGERWVGSWEMAAKKMLQRSGCSEPWQQVLQQLVKGPA